MGILHFPAVHQQVVLGAAAWLVQPCEADTRVSLLDKLDNGTRQFMIDRTPWSLLHESYCLVVRRSFFCHVVGVQ